MKKFQNNVLFALMAFATQEACASGLWGNLQSAAKNVLNTHGQQGQAAGVSGLTQGISAFAQTRNFDDLKNNFVSGAQQGFSQANLKKQADQLILEFFDEKETPTTTVAQKKAIQNLYSSQEYQQIINVIEQTNDIYIMLSKTADKVKNDNQATLMQMGDAIQNVDDTNIALVTQKIHDFVTSIAPAGSSKVQSSDGLSKEEVEAIVLEVIQENYGDLLQWVQQAMERERMQRNSQANNPFLPSNVGTKNSAQRQQANNPFMSNQPVQQPSRSGSSSTMQSGQNNSSMQAQSSQQPARSSSSTIQSGQNNSSMQTQSNQSNSNRNNQRG